MTLAPEGVRTMFDRIAPVYDVMNRVMTAGLDVRWRKLAAAAAVHPGDRVLDAACGTGDLAIADKRAGASRVTGLDFSEQMLARLPYVAQRGDRAREEHRPEARERVVELVAEPRRLHVHHFEADVRGANLLACGLDEAR